MALFGGGRVQVQSVARPAECRLPTLEQGESWRFSCSSCRCARRWMRVRCSRCLRSAQVDSSQQSGDGGRRTRWQLGACVRMGNLVVHGGLDSEELLQIVVVDFQPRGAAPQHPAPHSVRAWGDMRHSSAHTPPLNSRLATTTLLWTQNTASTAALGPLAAQEGSAAVGGGSPWRDCLG